MNSLGFMNFEASFFWFFKTWRTIRETKSALIDAQKHKTSLSAQWSFLSTFCLITLKSIKGYFWPILGSFLVVFWMLFRSINETKVELTDHCVLEELATFLKGCPFGSFSDVWVTDWHKLSPREMRACVAINAKEKHRKLFFAKNFLQLSLLSMENFYTYIFLHEWTVSI